MNKWMGSLAVLSLLYLVACQGEPVTPTPPPPSPTAEVIIVTIVATPIPTNIPFSTATALSVPSPSATATAFTPTVSPTVRASSTTRAPATPTRPRSTTTPLPAATPPDTLLDGDYVSSGNVRIQFTVSGGGTLANGGFFNFHCPVDGALETYGFANPAAIVGGKFAFSALPAPSGAPRVSMICTAVTLTQARCTMTDLAATNKCVDTVGIANRK